MPYELVALVVSGGLAVRYLSMSDPSTASKAAVGAVVGASLIVWWRYPEQMVVAVLLQVGASLYVLIYLKVYPDAS
jgi:hypothetical protein